MTSKVMSARPISSLTSAPVPNSFRIKEGATQETSNTPGAWTKAFDEFGENTAFIQLGHDIHESLTEDVLRPAYPVDEMQ
jgi:hypothetical protein